MRKVSNLTYREVEKILGNLGFEVYRHGKGSHELWIRHADQKVIPIPRHGSKSFRVGTMRAIIREAGVGEEEFLESIKD